MWHLPVNVQQMLPSDRWSSLEDLQLGHILPLSFISLLSLCLCALILYSCLCTFLTLFLHGVQVDGLQLAPDMGWTVNQLLATFSQLIISMERDSYFSQWIASYWPDFEEHAYPGTCPFSQQFDLMFRHLLWPELSPLSTNSYIEVLNPLVPQNVGTFWDKVFKDVIKVKWGLMGGLSSSLTDGLIRKH